MAEASIEDYDFTSGDAGASLTTPNEAGQIRVGGLVLSFFTFSQIIDLGNI